MQDLIIYFGVGIASAGTVVGLIAFCLHRKKKKKVAFYIESFNNYFRKNRDIRLTMLSMLKKYKKRSKEAQALKAGLYYLDNPFYKIMTVRYHTSLICLMMTGLTSCTTNVSKSYGK